MASFAVRYKALQAGLGEQQVVRAVTPELIRERVELGGAIVLVPQRADAPQVEPPLGSWRRVGDLYILDIGNPASTGRPSPSP